MGENEVTGIAGLHSQAVTDPGIEGDAGERPITIIKLGVAIESSLVHTLH